MQNQLRKAISCVIFDLDGTLINTEDIAREVLKVCLEKYGKYWDGREAERLAGKTHIEAASVIVEEYDLPCIPDHLVSESAPLYSDLSCKCKALPGANRLIEHLSSHSVPIALTSNSSKGSIYSKISGHKGWKESFSAIVGGDEVTEGKPSPEIFFEAAKKLNMEPSECLVIEDSMPGVIGGKAAGMHVVAVPSLPKQGHLFGAADEVINSLFDLDLSRWRLPIFQDWIEGTLPIEPWFIHGPVIKGFGRGSRILGIPTANLSAEDHSKELLEWPSGVYFGWAGLSTRGIYKMVMSIGWNPYFNNTEKTIEPWLLHDFEEDFYGEELRLVVVGYIRPEADFSTIEKLVEKIQQDRGIAERALDLPLYYKHKFSPLPH